jgi:hypothetical protein
VISSSMTSRSRGAALGGVMERVSQLVGAFLTFAPEMLDLSGGPLFRRAPGLG